MNKVLVISTEIVINIIASFIYDLIKNGHLDMLTFYSVAFFLTIFSVPITLSILWMIEKNREKKGRNQILKLYLDLNINEDIELAIVEKIATKELKLDLIEQLYSKEKFIQMVKFIGAIEAIEHLRKNITIHEAHEYSETEL